MVTIKPPNKVAVYHICNHLREVDAKEIYPLCYHDSPMLLAEQTYQAMKHGRGHVIWADGIPTAIIGVHPEHGGKACYRVFAFGTDDWKKAVYACMRELRRMVRDVIREDGTMRMHADSHEDHKEAHAWMKRMGGRCESVMRHYGKNGETYHRFVWLRDEIKWANDPNWQPFTKDLDICAEEEAQKWSPWNHIQDQ